MGFGGGDLHDRLLAPSKPKNIVTSVCIYILVMEMAERLCYYGLTGSLKAFLNNNLGFNQSQALSLVGALPAVVYLTPLWGGWVADTHWGSFKTILRCGCVYVTGTLLLAVASFPSLIESNLSLARGLFMFALFGLIGVGSGGIKANVVKMGGDQFDITDPEEARQKDVFFNYFYWMINIGALVSFLGIAQLATNGGRFVKKEDGFFASFCICTLCIFGAMIVFGGSASKFIMVPPKGSAFAEFISTFTASAKMTSQGRAVLFGIGLEAVGFTVATATALAGGGGDAGGYLANISGGSCLLGLLLISYFCYDCEWVARGNAGEAAEQQQVADVQQLLRVLPVLCCTMPFWIGYQQCAGAFYAQTCQFDIRVGGSQLNGALLQSFDCIAIIVCVPIFNNYLYPFVERLKGSKFTPLQQMGTGIGLMVLVQLLAAALELQRKASPLLVGPAEDVESNCAPAGVVMSDISTWWMALPYFLVGVCECFISIPLFDICYSEVPEALRSSAQAINLFVTALSGAMSASITTALSAYLTTDLNDGHLEYVYYVCAALSVLALPLFVAIARRFEYAVPPAAVVVDGAGGRLAGGGGGAVSGGGGGGSRPPSYIRSADVDEGTNDLRKGRGGSDLGFY